MKNLFCILSLAITITACQNTTDNSTAETEATTYAAPEPKPVFTSEASSADRMDKYWYQGKAEISHYELKQNRYSDLHDGYAVAIFVTEDFLTDKQVKNDNYSNPNSIPIFKLNLLKKFPTGIYDYSIMTSVFTPVQTTEYPQTLKVTNTNQDWCGHTFMQLNYRDNQYQSQVRSYFEAEGDQDKALPYSILEDELMSRIRMNPDALPTGKQQILPSTAFLRLKHQPTQAVEASAELSDYAGKDFKGKALRAYSLKFPRLQRTLEIVFQAKAPYIIEGWTDTYPEGGEVRTTIARRTNTVLEPYWKMNGTEDLSARAALGIE